MALVDGLDEQKLLERVLESAKPAVPEECRHLNWLLASPFRYGKYPRGSRFRRPGNSRGVFYGSEEATTAVAEMAHYRALFWRESPEAEKPKSFGQYTAFSVGVGSEVTFNLAASPLDRDQTIWTDPDDYSGCQLLADLARTRGVEIIRYVSIRDPEARRNAALLTCSAFGDHQPGDRQTWHIRVTDTGAEAICEYPDKRLSFPFS
ncbi:MAG: RES family NAD+ phosphorylase [Geminicoccaceae bacterium]